MTIKFKQEIGEILSVISPELFRAYNTVPTCDEVQLGDFILYVFERLLIKHYKVTLVGYVRTETNNGTRLFNASLVKMFDFFIQIRPDFDILFKSYINYHSMMDSGITKIVINNTSLEYHVNE